MSCRYNVTLSQALLTCSGGCQLIRARVGDIPLLPSNVIDSVMLSAQMVLMFFRLACEVYFPRVIGMSRRQGINQCTKINAKV